MADAWPLLVIAAVVFVFAALMVFFPVTVWRWRQAGAFKNPEEVEPSNRSLLSQEIAGLLIMITLFCSIMPLLNEDDPQPEVEVTDPGDAYLEFLFGTAEVQVVPLPVVEPTEGDAEFQLAPHYGAATDEQITALVMDGVIAGAIEADIWIVAQPGATAVQVEETETEVDILTFTPCGTATDRKPVCDEQLYADFEPEGTEWYGTTSRLTPIVLDADLDDRLVIDGYSLDEITLPGVVE